MTENWDLSTPQGALAFATHAHRDQRDKQGAPYIFHVARVGASLWRFPPDFAIAGFLHDVVEDTDYTLEDLGRFGASPQVLRAVAAVTKDTSERDLGAYEASIRKALADPVARWVKAADVSDNASRVGDIVWGPLHARLRAKYDMAERVIREAIPVFRVGAPLCPPTGHLTPV